LTDVIKKYKESQKVRNIKKVTRSYFLAEGHISLEKGDYTEAIKYFKNAQSFLAFPFPDNMKWFAWYFETLALAYYRSGDLEKAEEEFEKISKMTLGRVRSWDIYAKSFYMLGKISEQRGWPGKAIDHYEIFLELWKDADHGIAEVEDAKKRLALLQSN
jgi:tetratricopeptide (TPR) repeat protein